MPWEDQDFITQWEELPAHRLQEQPPRVAVPRGPYGARAKGVPGEKHLADQEADGVDGVARCLDDADPDPAQDEVLRVLDVPRGMVQDTGLVGVYGSLVNAQDAADPLDVG